MHLSQFQKQLHNYTTDHFDKSDTMNVNSILEYKKDPSEDFYGILGCDRNSIDEQISTEFKIRAKECHPDKSANRSDSRPEVFQQLLKVCKININYSRPI